VTTIASVAVRSRLDNEIVGIHFADGARVNKGDLLVTLDPRSLEAQIKQVEGNIARDQAQIDGAARDVRRYTDLVAKSATPVINLENAQTQLETFRGALAADQAALDNLKVQLSYCTIRAPISGRISQASVKVGNFVRSADAAPIAIINQMAPVYVTFTIPQNNLPDVRHALAAETANVEVIIPGEPQRASGVVTMIENAIDTTTGMATIRATMPNDDELLWPGTLVRARMTLRVDLSVVVPSAAVQVSQAGPFVYVVKDRKAIVQPVKVERVVGGETAISEGLQGGETVVTDGHLLLTNGSPVAPRERKDGV
jgi:membrane fusion protein, multidrug efflux system